MDTYRSAKATAIAKPVEKLAPRIIAAQMLSAVIALALWWATIGL